MINKINYFSILFIVLLIELSIVFNNSVIQVRLHEADYYLYKAAEDQNSQGTFIISSKYNMIKKRIEEGESFTDNYKLEGQIQAILSDDQSTISESKYTPLPAYHPVSIILQLLRIGLGKKDKLHKDNSDLLNKNIELSYFLERNRNYQKAISIYDTLLLDSTLNSQLYSTILLHKAFCISILGNFKESIKIYNNIHSKYPDTEAGELSTKMSSFIYSLMEKNRKLIDSKKTDIFIGRELYFNMNYSKALPYLNRAIKDSVPIIRDEAYYFKGRILEEQGLYRQAVLGYHEIMNIGENILWSREANRRLVILGDFYNQKHPLMEVAKRNLESIKDTNFLNSVSSIDEIITPTQYEDSLKAELLEEPLLIDDPEISNLSVIKDTVVNVPVKKVKPVKKIVSVPVKKKVVEVKRTFTKGEKIAMKRKLANSPSRKASFIRKTIEKNNPKLKGIYLKFTNTENSDNSEDFSNSNDITGRIVVKMCINASGDIEASIIKSDISDSSFNNAILQEIRKWRFPSIDNDLGSLTITYPFSFGQ